MIRNYNKSISYKLTLLIFCICFMRLGFGQLSDCPEGVGAGNDRVTVATSPLGNCAQEAITLGTCKNDAYTVKWTSVPEDLSLTAHPTFGDQSEFGQIIVKPVVSTRYTLTVNTRNPDLTCVYTVNVIVIDGIDMILTGNDANLANYSEIMEERQLSFKASVSIAGDIPADYGESMDDEPFIFKLKYNDANSNPKEDMITSFENAVEFTLDTDNIHNFINHNYVLNTKVSIMIGEEECESLINGFFEFVVYELWIEEFKLANQDKNWQVVVDRFIKYKGVAPESCSDFNWEMVDKDNNGDQVWALEFTGGVALKEGGAKIPKSRLPEDDNWDYFGDSFGTVMFSCTDGEGMTRKFYSRQVPGAGSEFMERDIKVYFEKNGKSNPSAAPNWFRYWKAAALNHLEIHSPDNNLVETGNLIYGGDNENTYGQTQWGLKQVTMFDKSSEESKPTSYTGFKGIDFFYEVLVHENHHIAIGEDRWGERAENYLSIYDQDMDGVKDNWENSTDGIDWDWEGSTNPMEWGFTTAGGPSVNNNEYGSGVPFSTCPIPENEQTDYCIHGDLGEPETSSDYKYQEYDCRQLQSNISSAVVQILHQYDWSYDPTRNYQGKQW